MQLKNWTKDTKQWFIGHWIWPAPKSDPKSGKQLRWYLQMPQLTDWEVSRLWHKEGNPGRSWKSLWVAETELGVWGAHGGWNSQSRALEGRQRLRENSSCLCRRSFWVTGWEFPQLLIWVVISTGVKGNYLRLGKESRWEGKIPGLHRESGILSISSNQSRNLL